MKNLLKPLALALLAALLLLLAVAAQADVLVCARPEDVLAVQEQITADTQVIVMTACTEKEQKTLKSLLTERGAPEVIQVKFKRLTKYKGSELTGSWKTTAKAYPRLLAALRQAQESRVLWYVDPTMTDLSVTVGELLRSACQTANDPTIRGDGSMAQSGCRILALTDLAAGLTEDIPDTDWLERLRQTWGDGSLPEIHGAPILNAEGFLDEGSFHLVDEAAGLWYYVSDNLRVVITRHTMQDKYPHVWFEADVLRRDGSDELLHCVTGSTKYKQTAYTDQMAQGWVLAINSDYYQFRVNNHYPIGLVMRAGQVVHGSSLGKLGNVGVPNLDCVLLDRSGGLSVHPAATLTPEDAAALDANDVLSFGPILIRDGRWQQINANHHDMHEPRTVLSSLGKDHYLLVFGEGRLTEALGLSLDELQQLLLARGAVNAINLDGGRTACMYFMGRQVGSVGNGKTAVSPRGQWELLVIGDLTK